MRMLKDGGDAVVIDWINDATSPTRDEIIKFLRDRSAGIVGHSGSSLLAHLEGVESILTSWREADTVSLAGLFHSIYGTESFRRSIAKPDDRQAVRLLIGPDAERLVHLFCGMRSGVLVESLRKGEPYALQTRWSDTPLNIDPRDMRALATIFAANWLEQFPRMRAKSRVSAIESLRFLAEWLGGPAQQAIN